MAKKELGDCFYCGRPLTHKNITKDHKVPQVLGGTNDSENIVKCCKTCNRDKGCLSYSEFKLVMAYRKGRVKLPKFKFAGEK